LEKAGFPTAGETTNIVQINPIYPHAPEGNVGGSLAFVIEPGAKVCIGYTPWKAALSSGCKPTR
jgi:hypothetical protein